eukprot:4757670-Pleurochrysis_carterae.AAC.1
MTALGLHLAKHGRRACDSRTWSERVRSAACSWSRWLRSVVFPEPKNPVRICSQSEVCGSDYIMQYKPYPVGSVDSHKRAAPHTLTAQR